MKATGRVCQLTTCANLQQSTLGKGSAVFDQFGPAEHEFDNILPIYEVTSISWVKSRKPDITVSIKLTEYVYIDLSDHVFQFDIHMMRPYKIKVVKRE